MSLRIIANIIILFFKDSRIVSFIHYHRAQIICMSEALLIMFKEQQKKKINTIKKERINRKGKIEIHASRTLTTDAYKNMYCIKIP